MSHDAYFINTHYARYIREFAAVYDVFSREQMGRGYGNGADFVQTQQYRPVFPAAFKDEHNRIAFFDAAVKEDPRSLI
jgi:hypothetical protein